MGLDPITKVSLGVAAIPTALAGGTVGMTIRNAPPEEDLQKTSEWVSSLNSDLESQLDSLIRGVVKDNVGTLEGELQTLESEVMRMEDKLDSNLWKDSSSLGASIESIKEKLIKSVSSGEGNLNFLIDQIKTQLQSSERKLKTQLLSKSQTLEVTINNLLDPLKNVISEKIESLLQSRKKILDGLKEKLNNLKKDKNFTFSKNCMVEVKTNGTEEAVAIPSSSITNSTQKQKLEDFLKTAQSSEDLTVVDKLKAKCLDFQGNGTIYVVKKSES